MPSIELKWDTKQTTAFLVGKRETTSKTSIIYYCVRMNQTMFKGITKIEGTPCTVWPQKSHHISDWGRNLEELREGIT